MDFRLIVDEPQSAAMNMAVDEAIMLSVKKTSMPTVRFYSWSPSAVSIGYFQGLEQEVDLQACKSNGVEFVRRITGGGAVFHESELTYSFVCAQNSKLVSEKIIDSYKKICQPIINGLKQLDIDAGFVPLNDIVVQGKKISGNAQTRRAGMVLQHGTILIQVDVDKMFSLLKVPDEKMRGKLISDIKQRVTSIEQQKGKKVGFKELAFCLQNGFEEEFNARLVKGVLSVEEKNLAEKIAKERFLAKEWNFRR